jgi:hypothetical protein
MRRLGIVIPLKSKKVARDWNVVCNLLSRTLASIEHQSDRRYEVAIVGHDMPEFIRGSTWQAAFVSVTHPIPDLSGDRDSQRRARGWDQGEKIRLGVVALSPKAITDWFVLDADDWVHRSMVQFVLNKPSNTGLVLDGGYIFSLRSEWAMPKKDLSKYCGSTAVIPSSALNGENEFRDAPWLRYAHMDMDSFFRDNEVPFTKVFEPLVCWVVDHGDNTHELDYGKDKVALVKNLVKKALFSWPFNKKVKRNFSQA